MEAVVELRGELLGRHPDAGHQVGPAHVAEEQRIAREDRHGVDRVLLEVVHQHADALGRVAGGLEEREAHGPELDPVAVARRDVGVLGAGRGPDVDPRSGGLRELEVPGDEVGVEVREDHVADLHAEPGRLLEVLRDVALRVHHHRRARALVGQ